jgi:hypothetical protein
MSVNKVDSSIFCYSPHFLYYMCSLSLVLSVKILNLYFIFPIVLQILLSHLLVSSCLLGNHVAFLSLNAF